MPAIEVENSGRFAPDMGQSVTGMDFEPFAGMPARFRKVPYRAVRDTSLPAGALRLLIAIACNADGEGLCDLQSDRLATEVGLTPDDIDQFSEYLAEAHYVEADREDGQWHYRLVSEPTGTNDYDVRQKGRSRKANGRSRGVSRMMRAWRTADRFSFWLRTVLPPDDTDLFWSWALRNEDEYHDLVQRFGEAREDAALAALLCDTAAVIADPAPEPAGLPGHSSVA